MHISNSSNLVLGSHVKKITRMWNTNSLGEGEGEAGEGEGGAPQNALTKEMQLEMIFRETARWKRSYFFIIRWLKATCLKMSNDQNLHAPNKQKKERQFDCSHFSASQRRSAQTLIKIFCVRTFFPAKVTKSCSIRIAVESFQAQAADIDKIEIRQNMWWNSAVQEFSPP